jgi:hypothetical protein
MTTSCGNCGAATSREPLCEQCNDDDINNTHGMAFEIERLQSIIAERDKREPLVQEVIAKHQALTHCVLYGRSDCENEDAALVDALNKLAEWKP